MFLFMKREEGSFLQRRDAEGEQEQGTGPASLCTWETHVAAAVGPRFTPVRVGRTARRPLRGLHVESPLPPAVLPLGGTPRGRKHSVQETPSTRVHRSITHRGRKAGAAQAPVTRRVGQQGVSAHAAEGEDLDLNRKEKLTGATTWTHLEDLVLPVSHRSTDTDPAWPGLRGGGGRAQRQWQLQLVLVAGAVFTADSAAVLREEQVLETDGAADALHTPELGT